MLVSHSKRFIYLKTAKTAGTSVEVALEPYCAGPDHTPEHFTPERVSEYGIIGARGPDAGSSTYRNHIHAADLKALLGDEVWDAYEKICVVRNPYDKVVSFFWMLLPVDHPARREGADFAEARAAFTDWVTQGPQWPFDLGVYTLDGQVCVDRILRFERLSADLEQLCADLKIGVPKLGQFKSQARQFKTVSFQHYYDAETAARAAEAFARDFELLGYALDSWRA